MASLVAADGTSFELAETDTLVGRGGREYNDPPKMDVGPLRGGPTVSRRHARVYRRAGQWYLRAEPEARNPTLVGGRRVPGGEEVPLVDDTRIQLGDVVLTFKAPAHARPESPDVTMAEGDGQIVTPSEPPPPAPSPIVTPLATPAPGQAPAAQAPAVTPAQPQATEVVPTQPPPVARWAARLPDRPTALTALRVGELKRVNPFRGLMIDEEAWADAHDYHRTQAQLHLLSAHGWGIVEGLEVVADPQVPNTLVIRPGVAVDSLGRYLLINQQRRLPIKAAPGTTLYVYVRWHEELTQPQRFWNDLDEYTRVVERCEALVQTSAQGAPALELARLTVEGPIRNAPDPLNPQPGEIDLRFREQLMVRPRPELAVGQLVLPEGNGASPAASHRLGLRYLLREIGLATPYRPRWAGVFQPGDALPPLSLLYLAGSGRFALGDGAVGRLRDFLQGGGVLLADACSQGQVAEFAAAVESLAGPLDCRLEPVKRWHPVLLARHVFAEPPLAGRDGAGIAAGGGLILSTADLGCAWQGGSEDSPLSRETIRSALELGVNVAVYARQRQRPLEIVELEV